MPSTDPQAAIVQAIENAADVCRQDEIWLSSILETLALSVGKVTRQHDQAINGVLVNANQQYGSPRTAAERAVFTSAIDVASTAAWTLQAVDELLADLCAARGDTDVLAIRHTTMLDLKDSSEAVKGNTDHLLKRIDEQLRLDPTADERQAS